MGWLYLAFQRLAEIGRIAYPKPPATDPHGKGWDGLPCPCYISTDATGKHIFTSFYTAGMLTVRRSMLHAGRSTEVAPHEGRSTRATPRGFATRGSLHESRRR